jgi:hypothetical protein
LPEAALALVHVPISPEPIRLSMPWQPQHEQAAVPLGGECPWWTADGKLTYSLGHTYFVDGHGSDILVQASVDRPRGTVILSNARLLTMGPAGVLEHGDVLIRDNRIATVGTHGTISVPDSVTRIDLTGKTLLPGYVLTHEHIPEPEGVHVPRVWSYLAALAFGITTVHDPQADSLDRFSYADVLQTGALLGPRHISTGKAITEQPIESLADTRDLVQRYSNYYGTITLKERGVGQRLLRQWVAIAANEQRLTTVAHWHEDLESHVLDGYSGLEHATFIPLYNDAIQLMARSGVVYTPTTMQSSLGLDYPSALRYFDAHNWATSQSDPRLRNFVQWSGCRFMVECCASSGERPGELDGTTFVQEAQSAAKLVAAGGRVAIGTDVEPFWALPAHWEMWALAMGGMTPAQILHSATVTGAEAIGLDQDLGSIEPGKLADLQILDQNPLDDIHNTLSVSRVMRNGRLYDTRTLDEVWPERRSFLTSPDDHPYWWSEWPITARKTQ